MSVLIKGVEIPNNCGECQFCHTESFTQWCCPTGREDVSYDSVPQWCPLDESVKWIPCSERQPEETNLYWVTVKPIDSEMLEVTPRWYFGRGYGDGWEAELYEPPLAWMPMEWPDPWRGEEDG